MVKILRLVIIGACSLAACTAGGTAQESLPATATLAPIVSMTPRFTATPMATRTPLPTFTLTPSETPIPPTPSDTPTPSATPPIVGIIASIDTVNVREGPAATFRAFVALPPGTRVEVLGQSADGRWLNIKLEDNREGWVFEQLLRLQETATPFPTVTPTPDLTAIAQGTVFPTALLGGGTVTPTPPASVISPTPVTASPTDSDEPAASPTSFLPIIDVDAINQTATALAGGVVAPTQPPTAGPTSTQIPGQPTSAGPTSSPLPSPLPGTVAVQENVNVLAYCDNPFFGVAAPTNLAAGSTIRIWWSWFARTEQQVRDHLENAIYEVAIDGVRLTNIQLYQTSIRREANNDYYVYWYVPAGPLTAGQHRITYRVTWRATISDGYEMFGPGTNNTEETGSCTFTVR